MELLKITAEIKEMAREIEELQKKRAELERQEHDIMSDFIKKLHVPEETRIDREKEELRKKLIEQIYELGEEIHSLADDIIEKAIPVKNDGTTSDLRDVHPKFDAAFVTVLNEDGDILDALEVLDDIFCGRD